jgi:hypothetical protein
MKAGRMNLHAKADPHSRRFGTLRRGVAASLATAVLAACSGSPSTPTAAPVVTTSTTELATTTTTVAPTTTTTIEPSVQFTIDTCKKLDTLGYETRKKIIASVDADFLAAGGTGSGIDSVKATCAPSVDRMVKANELQGRLADAVSNNAVTITDFHCANGRFDLMVTNNAADPFGFTFVADITSNGQSIETNEEPVVAWSVEPGESQKVNGSWIVPEEPGELGCNVNADGFLADDSPADAALPTSTNALLRSPDPAIFFPEIWRLEPLAKTMDDPAVTEDLRSTAYRRLVKNIGAQADHWPRTSVVICPGSTRQPRVNLMSFVYYATYGPHTEKIDEKDVQVASSQHLEFGAFRRGSDGQWRWLGKSRRIDSSAYRSCGTPGRTLAEG